MLDQKSQYLSLVDGQQVSGGCRYAAFSSGRVWVKTNWTFERSIIYLGRKDFLPSTEPPHPWVFAVSLLVQEGGAHISIRQDGADVSVAVISMLAWSLAMLVALWTVAWWDGPGHNPCSGPFLVLHLSLTVLYWLSFGPVLVHRLPAGTGVNRPRWAADDPEQPCVCLDRRATFPGDK